MQTEIRKIVMYIDNMYHGGAQRVMANLVGYFVREGVQVVLVNDFRAQPGVPVYEVPAGVKRVYLRETLGGNPLAKNLERMKNLRAILKTERPEIALSFLGRPNLRMLLAAKGLPCKTIVSVRNDPNREYGASRLKKVQQQFRHGGRACVQTAKSHSRLPH